MASKNNLIVTDNGLSKICKKIIGKGTFRKDLINTNGTLTYKNDNVVEGFSTNNYFYSSISISSEDIIISVNGQFFTSNSNQCLWNLTGVETSPISLLFSNNSILLTLGGSTICGLYNATLPDQSNIITKVRITPNTCELLIYCDGELFHKVANVPLITPSDFSQILIGTDGNLSWNGLIDMSSLSVGSTEGIIYTPSSDESFQFMKILVGDGSVPLSQNPSEFVNHIYKIENLEIENSGNGIDIKGELDEKASLTIKEIALFDNADNKLFALVSNLNIFKPADINYKLIFNIDLSLKVVNITGFPSTGDIVVEEPEYINTHDFDIFRQTHEYDVATMERLIRQNAAELATNTPQEYYRLEQDINAQEESYNAVENYSQLSKMFTFETEEVFDPTSIKIKGSLNVPSNGVTSNFSSTDFLDRNDYYLQKYNWEDVCNFNTETNSTGTVQCFGSPCINQPYELYVQNGYCAADLGCLESIEVDILDEADNIFFYRHPIDDYSFYLEALTWENPENEEQLTDTMWDESTWTRSSNQVYAAWYNQDNNVFLDRLTSAEIVDNINSHTFSGIGDELEWTYPCPLAPSYQWSFSIGQINLTDLSGNDPQYIIGKGKDINGNPAQNTFKLFIDENRKLNFIPYYGTNPAVSISTLTSTSTLSEGYTYTFIVGFNGSAYSLEVKGTAPNQPEIDEIVTYETTSPMNWNISTLSITLGATYDSSTSSYISPLKAEIQNLSQVIMSNNYKPIWSAYVPLKTIYTISHDPAVGTEVFDSYGYSINTSAIRDVFSSKIFSGNLFRIKPYHNYSVKLISSYDNDTSLYSYDFYYSVDGEAYTYLNSLNITSSLPINESKDLIIGGKPDYVDFELTNVSNPYSDSVNLLNYYLNVEGSVWDMKEEVVLQDSSLLQYYHVPKLNRLNYTVQDLTNFSYTLNVYDSIFTGNTDLINFNDEKGVSLLIKTHLKDMENKFILGKKLIERSLGTYYFTLELIDYKLVFTLYTEGSSFVLSKEIKLEEYESYTEYPILITITYNGLEYNPEFTMYKNNEKIAYTNSGNGEMMEVSNYVLSNFKEDTPSSLYVSDILFIKGVLTSEYLYKINNLFDTNY